MNNPVKSSEITIFYRPQEQRRFHRWFPEDSTSSVCVTWNISWRTWHHGTNDGWKKIGDDDVRRIHLYLGDVVWLPFVYVPINIGLLIIPIDELIFFRGVAQPPTRYMSFDGISWDMIKSWVFYRDYILNFMGLDDMMMGSIRFHLVLFPSKDSSSWHPGLVETRLPQHNRRLGFVVSFTFSVPRMASMGQWAWLGNHPHLVGGLEHQFYVPINIGLLIIPIDELIFFRGVQTTNQP